MRPPSTARAPESATIEYRTWSLGDKAPPSEAWRGRAELVVEIRSGNDETYDKLDFYADLQVQEVFVADPDACTVELFVLRGGRLHAAPARSDRVSHLGGARRLVRGH